MLLLGLNIPSITFLGLSITKIGVCLYRSITFLGLSITKIGVSITFLGVDISMCGKPVDNFHIYKSNNLIESSYKLTVAEQRLIYMGIKKLKPIFINKNLPITEVKKMIEANTFGEVSISVMEYKKEFKVNANNLYENMIDICDKLYDRTIKYYDGKSLIKKRWVITSKYDDENKEIKLRFHPDLIMDLLVFKNRFTILKYDVTKSIKSSYGYRLYELLKQYEKIGVREFYVDDFRYILGIPDELYPKYANLKQRVIMPSIKSLNKNTDISVEFNEFRKNRKIHRIQFKISKNNKSPKKVIYEQLCIDCFDDERSLNNSPFIQLQNMINFDITSEQADKIFDIAIESINDKQLQIGVLDYIQEKINILKEYQLNKPIKNRLGMLISALKEDWQMKAVKDSFNNFEQRTYDYDKLERDLLGWSNEV